MEREWSGERTKFCRSRSAPAPLTCSGSDYQVSVLDSCNSELAFKGYATKAQSQSHPHMQDDEVMVCVKFRVNWISYSREI